MRGELEGAVEGIGDGEKISWEERGQLTLTPPPHSAQGHKGVWLVVGVGVQGAGGGAPRQLPAILLEITASHTVA